jgi:hypothetical protein
MYHRFFPRGEPVLQAAEWIVGIDGLIALKTDPPQLGIADAEGWHAALWHQARARTLPGERDRNFRLAATAARIFTCQGGRSASR